MVGQILRGKDSRPKSLPHTTGGPLSDNQAHDDQTHETPSQVRYTTEVPSGSPIPVVIITESRHSPRCYRRCHTRSKILRCSLDLLNKRTQPCYTYFGKKEYTSFYHLTRLSEVVLETVVVSTVDDRTENAEN